jgi:hypothetical protein
VSARAINDKEAISSFFIIGPLGLRV